MASTRSIDARAVGTGGAVGAAAYGLGYLVTYVTQRGLVQDRIRGFNAIAELFGGDPIPVWKAVAWLLYNAHFVVTEVPGFGGTRTENFIATADEGSLVLLYLVPPLALLAAGAAVALLSTARTPGAGGAGGALVVVGYLPLAVGVAIVSGYAVGDGTVAPDLVTATLLAGVVYPLVFGAVGGAAVGAVVGRRSSVGRGRLRPPG